MIALVPTAQRVRMCKFSLVGVSGLLVNTVVLAIVSGPIGLHYIAGAIVATQVSSVWNFALTDRWVFGRDHVRSHLAVRFFQFWAMNNVMLIARGPVLVFMTASLGIHYLVSNIVTLVLAFVARYVIADRFIWRRHVPAVDGVAVP